LPENAAFIESLLAGAEQTPEEEARREIVVINASAALVAAGAAGGFREGAELADKALREGDAARKLDALRSFGEG